MLEESIIDEMLYLDNAIIKGREDRFTQGMIDFWNYNRPKMINHFLGTEDEYEHWSNETSNL